MTGEYNLSTTEFSSVKLASKKMFDTISSRLNVNTAYVTRKGETAMTVLSSYNKEEEIIPEGYSVEYGGTYCRLIISNQSSSMTTTNLAKDELTRELEVTSQLQVKGFLGVTLFDSSGEVFGTLCVMDKEEKQFSDDDISFLNSMASVLSYLIELDQTKYNIGFMNVPIIPITQGISVLPIQGVIDQNRSDKILQTVLKEGFEKQIEHFIIDLSGLVILDNQFPTVVTELVQSLKLMGIEVIITGMRPEVAKQEVNNVQLLNLQTKTVATLESALNSIGFHLHSNS